MAGLAGSRGHMCVPPRVWSCGAARDAGAPGGDRCLDLARRDGRGVSCHGVPCDGGRWDGRPGTLDPAGTGAGGATVMVRQLNG